MLINSKAQIERKTRICIFCTTVYFRAEQPVFSSQKEYSKKKEPRARDSTLAERKYKDDQDLHDLNNLVAALFRLESSKDPQQLLDVVIHLLQRLNRTKARHSTTCRYRPVQPGLVP